MYIFTPVSDFILCDLIFKLTLSQEAICMGFNNSNSISYLFIRNENDSFLC